MRTNTALTQIRAQAPKIDVAPVPEPISTPPSVPQTARDATAILISGRLPDSDAEKTGQ